MAEETKSGVAADESRDPVKESGKQERQTGLTRARQSRRKTTKQTGRQTAKRTRQQENSQEGRKEGRHGEVDAGKIK